VGLPALEEFGLLVVAGLGISSAEATKGANRQININRESKCLLWKSFMVGIAPVSIVFFLLPGDCGGVGTSANLYGIEINIQAERNK